MAEVRSSPSRRLIAGGTALLLGPVQYALAQVVAAWAWPTRYRWSANSISDLGNTACGGFSVPHGATSYVCSPWHAVMNASFVVSGLLLIVGVLLLRPWWPAGRTAAAGCVLLLAAGVGRMLTGLVPENTNLSLHLLGAANIPLAALGVVLVSQGWRATHRSLALVGLILGGLGLAASVLLTAAQAVGPALLLGLGAGGMERVGSYTSSIWQLVVGVAALTAGLRQGTPSDVPAAARPAATSRA